MKTGTWVGVLVSCILSLAGASAARAETDSQIRIDDMVFDSEDLEVGILSTGMKYYSASPWKDGYMPVQFAPEITPQQRKMFFEECQKWTRLANVRCGLRKREHQYLRVVNDPKDGCKVHVGRRSWGRISEMNMPGCWTPGQITHEIGHAFGLIHEHQRADRDRYVTVDRSAVDPKMAHAYDLISTSVQNGPYDFMSIMHYPRDSYALPGKIIMTPKPGFESYRIDMGMTVWRSAEPTALDGRSLASLYGPPVP